MNPFRFARPLIALALLVGTAPAWAADAEAEMDALRAHIADAYPQLTVDAVRPTPLDGIYEVVSGTSVLYLSADGRYLLRGSLIDLEAKRDLTGERRNGLLHDAVDALDEDSMLVYEPAEGPAEHTITVFTDTSCPYCQRLHEDLLGVIERHPVRVRYLMFPRAGPDSDAADTMRDVWCAPDPHAALTRAKRGKSVPARDENCETALAEHFATGQRIEIGGTPYLLIDDDGPAFSGYRPTEQLLPMLGIEPQAAK